MKGRKMLMMCLSILMVLGMVGGFSLTAKAQTYGDFKYSIDEYDNTVFITGYTGSKSSITIPGKIDGRKVSLIDIEAFANNKTLKNVVIENGMDEISNNAFYSCEKLESITIPDSVRCIGAKAFARCRELKIVVLGNQLKEIENEAFVGCMNLKSITIPNSVLNIGEEAFVGSDLEKITLPSKLEVISKAMFQGCEKLKSITIPTSVKKIEEGVFYGSDEFNRVNYKGTIAQWKKIKIDYTDNENLKGATIYCTDGTIRQVKSTEFSEEKVGRQFIKVTWEKVKNASGYEIQLATDKKFTKNKKTVRIENQNETSTVIKNLKANQKYYLRGRTYKNTSIYSDWSRINTIKLLTQKSNNKVTGDYEYTINKNNTVTITAYCGNKVEATIPSKLGGKKVVKIGENAFKFYNIEKVKIPSTVTEIGLYAFSYCHKLESVDLSKSLKKIDNGAFDECMKLKKIVIPDGVTEIGDFAFLHCPKLTSVKQSKNLKKLGIDDFYGCGFKSITIPNGVKEIPSGLFGDCKSLTKVVLPNNITKIGENAFYFTKLKTITIPKSVKKIDEYAFSDSFYLCHIKYTGTKKQWKSIKIGKNNEELTNAMISCKDATINNKGVKIKTVTKANKAVKVSWSKVSKASGYKIQVATNSKFTKVAKTVLVSTPKTTSVTIKGLKANKKYYVRICTYSTKKIFDNASTNLYYPWSNVKSVTTK